MAAAGSLKTFYWGLALVAVAGGLVIVRAASQKGPPLTVDTAAPLATGPRGVVLGPESAQVEIMEFSDFECPYCARFAVLQMPDVRQRLLGTGKVRWRFVNFPLQSHTRSPYAHLAAACANQQGRFWEMEDLLYQNQDEWVESGSFEKVIDGYAERAGVDKPRYQACIANRAAWGEVLADKHLADSLGLDGTPTFFVNGHMLSATTSVTVDLLLRMVDSITAARPAAPGQRRPARAAR